MTGYPKSFATSSFSEQSDGRWSATVKAETHGLGTNYTVTKALRRTSDLIWKNMILSYEILTNGDFVLYVDEPAVYKVYLLGD